MVRRSFLLVFSLLWFSASALAQPTIALTGPLTGVVVREGDDFATDELKNSWDFNERRDFAWEENIDPVTVTVSGGIWTANNDNGRDTLLDPNAPAFMMPLFGGLAHGAQVQGLPGDKSLPEPGIYNKINTAKYTLLSMRMRHPTPGDIAFSWKSNLNATNYFPTPTDPIWRAKWGTNIPAMPILENDWAIRSFNFANTADFIYRQGNWSGTAPYSLRIEPSMNAADGVPVSFDWIRLVDPLSAPNLTISWNVTGGVLSPGDVVTVYVDNNSTGFDGVPLTHFSTLAPPNSYTFPTAMLPPGRYYFYVAVSGNCSPNLCGAPYLQTGYSAALTIRAKPSGHFVSPSPATGADYATTVNGNAWDMANAQDLLNLDTTLYPQNLRYFVNGAITPSSSAQQGGRLFRATSSLPSSPSMYDHVQMYLQTALREPIDPMKYRYLTYRMRVIDTAVPSISDKLKQGIVANTFYFNTLDGDIDSKTKPNIIYEGWHTYTIDLWDTENTEGDPYLSDYRYSTFAFSPLERPAPTTFEVDWIKLTEENKPQNNQFVVTFRVEDSDSSTVNVDLFYDLDGDGFDGVLINSFTGLPVGSHNYTWNTSALPAGGVVYVYAIVSDGLNSSGFYSDVPIRLGAVPTFVKYTPHDFDGDGKSDQAVYRSGAGQFFQNWSDSLSVLIHWVAGNRYEQLLGDFDGDGVQDLTVVFRMSGYYVWFIYQSSTQTLRPRVWGAANDQIVVADYTGDGSDDIAVYRDGIWFILDENENFIVDFWGDVGDHPVPADYDGDGKADIAIWRPGLGEWWILNSGYEDNYTADLLTYVQWGLPGDIPVPGDYFDVGIASPAVWRPWNGAWYLLDVEDLEYEVHQWGFSGDVPVVGDFNGDGRTDLTVYRDSGGYWFHNFRNLQTQAVQYGLPGDKLPRRFVR